MHCEQNKETLMNVAAGTLTAKGQAQIETHLAVCEDCRREIEQLRELFAAIDGSVAASVAAEPTPELAVRVAARMRDPQTFDAGWSLGRVAMLAGVVIALVIAGLIARRPAKDMPVIATGNAQVAERQPGVPARMNEVSPLAMHTRGKRIVDGNHLEVTPQTLVPRDEVDAIHRLYRALQQPTESSGTLAIETALAAPIQQPLTDQKIEPLEIAPLDDVLTQAGS